MTDGMKDIDPLRVVCVFGSGKIESDHYEWRLAYETGRQLAELGYTVANGGYAGTMEASANGAKDAGGTVLAVTCKLWGASANSYTDRTMCTEDLPERIETLIDLGQGGYVVLPGATGTLAEFAWAWELMLKKAVPARPIVCVGDFWRPLIEMMSIRRPEGSQFVSVVSSPAELLVHFPGR